MDRLFFLRKTKKDKWGKSVGLYRCICGVEKEISISKVNQRKTVSCGCYSKRNLLHIKHGLAKTRQYRIWEGIKQRCNNVKNSQFHNYGGRGISYCSKWKTFEGFWEDMEKGYLDNLSIDRINNDSNYSKENCRWSTHIEQSNNKRNSIKIIYENKVFTIRELSILLNLTYYKTYEKFKRKR